MKTKLLTLATTGALLLASSSPILAASDSIKSTAEQRIENAAIELAAEATELATTAVKQAKKDTKNVQEYVKNRLDDTLIAEGKPVHRYPTSDEYMQNHNSNLEVLDPIVKEGMDFAENIAKGTFYFILAIIIFGFLASYLKRRQKYKVIEKAIENNYPLPPGFLGKEVRPTTIQHIHYTQEVPMGATAKPNTNGKITKNVKNMTEFDVSDWASFRSGIKWCAWGLSFFIFFLLMEAEIAAFALIPLIIGAGKLYAAYKIQQAIDNARKHSEPVNEEKQSSPTPPPFNEVNKNESEN